MRLLAALPLGVGVCLAVSACSSSGDSEREEQKRIEEGRTQTFDLYGRYVDDTTNRYFACLDELEATGQCAIQDTTTKKTVRIVLVGPRTQGLRETLARARQVGAMVRQLMSDAKRKMCETVAPFARLQHPYFFTGVSGTAGVVGAGTGNVEVYYDLWNNQSAVFTGVGVSAGTTSGVEAGAYMGYAFGNLPNVVDAGGGRQCAVSGGLGIKAIAGVSITGSVFSNPEGTLVGGSVGVSASAGLWEVPVDVTASVTDSGGWDAATRALGANGWGYRRDIITDAKTGDQYVQYAGPVDHAIAMLWNLPPPQSVAVATQILAIGALKETGLTIEQACPNEVAAIPPPDTGIVGEACNALPNFRGNGDPAPGGGEPTPGGGNAPGGTPGKLDPSDCGDKTDGWWCFGQGGGYMAYCQGRQIAGGCGCAGCTAGGVPAGCSAPPPPAACPLN